MSIKMGPAIARAGVILGCIGSPSILGAVVPLTLSEPFTIGVAVTSAVELDAAALVDLARFSEVLPIPSDGAMDVTLPTEDAGEWLVEAAAASLVEAAASRGSAGNRSAVVTEHFSAISMAEAAK